MESDLKSNKTEQSVKNVNKAEPETSKDKNKAEVSPSHYFSVTGFKIYSCSAFIFCTGWAAYIE